MFMGKLALALLQHRDSIQDIVLCFYFTIFIRYLYDKCKQIIQTICK